MSGVVCHMSMMRDGVACRLFEFHFLFEIRGVVPKDVSTSLMWITFIIDSDSLGKGIPILPLFPPSSHFS